MTEGFIFAKYHIIERFIVIAKSSQPRRTPYWFTEYGLPKASTPTFYKFTSERNTAMDEKFMRAALTRAKRAAALGELPVGAVIVKDNRVIASGYNKRELKQNALLHAEMTAIDRACKKLGSWRLTDCDMYVTLEPCPMCAGAAINARLGHVYFGAYDDKSGCVHSRANLLGMNLLSHTIPYEGGIMEAECSALIKDFFANLRKRPKRRAATEDKNEV